MNAAPLLHRGAVAFQKVRLDAVMIGTAAAAIQGAPVTTLAIDFMLRETLRNIEKLKTLAKLLDAVYLDASSPLTSLRRIENEEQGLFLDFLTRIDGISSFASLRSRAVPVDFGELSFASLRWKISSEVTALRIEAKIKPSLRFWRKHLRKKRKQERKEE